MEIYSKSGISSLLNNPFYIGLMKIDRTGEVFRGAHQPLISKELFDRVQAVLQGRTFTGVLTHDFLYRRLFQCASCGRVLVGERQKGRVYYRCHGGCGNALREDHACEQVLLALSPLQMSDDELKVLYDALDYLDETSVDRNAELTSTLTLQLDTVKARYERLLDAYVDRLISKDDFEFKKEKLLAEERGLKDRLAEISADPAAHTRKLRIALELAKDVCLSYAAAPPEEKRQLLKEVSSNRLLEQKKLAITIHYPFREIANRPKIADGGPYRDGVRTFVAMLCAGAQEDNILPVPANDNHFRKEAV